MKDKHIEGGNQDHIHNDVGNHHEPINDVDLDGCTGQPGKTHVLTVRMRDDVMPTEGQPQNEKHERSHQN